MVLKLQGNVMKKKRAREKQVDFNPFSASQMKNKERMNRQLEDDDNNNYGSNFNGKKRCYHIRMF